MTLKIGDLVIIRDDNEYWEIRDLNGDGTGVLVPRSRHQDPYWARKFNGDYAYPAPVALWSNQKGGGSSLRIPERWWNKVRSMNTGGAWKAMRRNNGGWINYAANKEYPGGVAVPDPPDPYPRTEAITSARNVHKVEEVTDTAVRIGAYKYSDPVPDKIDFYKMCDFSSIAPDGTVAWMGWKFPLLVEKEAWIPKTKVTLYEKTEEQPMPDEVIEEERDKGHIVIFRGTNQFPKVDRVYEEHEPGLYESMLDPFITRHEEKYFLWPTEFTGVVTQAFGINAAYYSQFGLPGHEGIDMRAREGTKIFSCWDGEVVRRDLHSAYGNHIRIRAEMDGDTHEFVYAHFSIPSPLSVGDKVKKGGVIGTAGNTGNSSGAHLHFMLKNLDVVTEYPYSIIDPTPFFKELQ